MYFREKTNQYVIAGQPFSIEGISYPSNWVNLSSDSDKMRLELVEVKQINEPADRRYYWVTEHLEGAELQYVNTPMDLGDLKTRSLKDINKTIGNLLSASDWRVIKSSELNEPMDPVWKTWRDSIRAYGVATKDSVNNVNSIEELKVVLTNIKWPEAPN
jgi:hypothetical protein